MKFKALLVTFNIVLILSFITIFLLPLFLLDGTFMVEFWRKNWFFSVIFLVVILAVNGIFISQWKMLSCLENEDWPALSQYLENEVFTLKRYNPRRIRLLCDALLLLGDFATIRRLEAVIREKRPAMLAGLSVRLSSAAMLSGDYEYMFSIADRPSGTSGPDDDWRDFLAGFALHLGRKFQLAADRFEPLALRARDPLVAALSAYLAGEVLAGNLPGRKVSLSAVASEARSRVLAQCSRKKWDERVETAKGEMHAVILGKLIDEAAAWLYGNAPAGSTVSGPLPQAT